MGPAGQLTLWASTQGSFNTRSEVADILGLEENQIKVIPMECGGGFGGKIRALCEPITAVLAKASGRPVRYVMTRREELDAGIPAPQVIIKLKTGCKRDGTLMALDAETIIESGAFSGAVLTMSAVFIASVYKFPNFEVRGFEVLTHKPSIAAYRAPTAPQTFFAIDSQMELMAHALGRRRRRVPHAPPDEGRRSDGQRPAVAVQRRQAGAGAARRASAVEEPGGVVDRAATRTAMACAARGWPWAAGSPACSRPARRYG